MFLRLSMWQIFPPIWQDELAFYIFQRASWNKILYKCLLLILIIYQNNLIKLYIIQTHNNDIVMSKYSCKSFICNKLCLEKGVGRWSWPFKEYICNELNPRNVELIMKSELLKRKSCSDIQVFHLNIPKFIYSWYPVLFINNKLMTGLRLLACFS